MCTRQHSSCYPTEMGRFAAMVASVENPSFAVGTPPEDGRADSIRADLEAAVASLKQSSMEPQTVEAMESVLRA